MKPVLIFCAMFLTVSTLHAQRFVDSSKGNVVYTKQGIMDGNFVRTIFLNHGEIAHWPDKPSGEWPKGSGHQYIDGISMIVQSEAVDSGGNIIHPLETNYREFIRKDPVTKIPWGWGPLPGYANANQNEPAMSHKPETWPSTWPDRSSEWDGLWNGFFGRGIQNADLETYFRMDDAPDKQYAYWPNPDDSSRGGLGLQVAVRGFQWSQVLAADVIFWYYEITNTAKQDHTKTVFAQYVDWGIGGTEDSSDDRGSFDTQLDIAWAFDGDGIGAPANWSPVGVAGYAFLESPGIAVNGFDDDSDGLLDETRDNDAGVYLEAFPYGVSDVEKFRQFYNREPGPHWSGDENANWVSYNDLNENGSWDNGEPLNDDTGSDGLSPFDDAYPGPDTDGTQGNHKPDQGEPNFGILDKDESDQIGLTGFSIFPVHFYELHDDEQNWEVLTTPIDSTGFQQLNDVNLGMYFSAGARPRGSFPGNMFPLQQLQTERFSMALLFGDDRDDLVRRKKTVQQIYNANYRFARPPDKPRLTAVPGDKKVTLYWDDRAEQSFDPFLQELDFEGYRIYKSTEASFLEDLVITDAFGKKTFRKPLAQFDLVNGVRGLHPLDINGVKFFLGENSGLRHSYVDTDVQNGQTYYYAVVSYDRGFYTLTVAGEPDGIPPSECSAIIRTDLGGNSKVDVNTAVVVPRSNAAGYESAGIDGGILHDGPGSGRVEVHVLNPDLVPEGHVYRITFTNPTPFQNGTTPLFAMTNVTTGEELISDRPVVAVGEETPIVDGMIGYVFNDKTVTLDEAQTEWVAGNSNAVVVVDHLEEDPAYRNVSVRYPADLEVRFSNQIVDTSAQVTFFDVPIPVQFTIWNLTENKKAHFLFLDTNGDQLLSVGERLIIVSGDSLGKSPVVGNYRASLSVRLAQDTSLGVLRMPQDGDVFRIVSTKPFRTGESFQFRVRGESTDAVAAGRDLGKIAVVPNPYVGAASWEPQNLFRSGRGERRAFFINLPSRCTIRVYTIRGHLVQTIEHDAASGDGQESWNLVSKDGMDVAFGVYVFHVDAPGVGQIVGKFAIVK